MMRFSKPLSPSKKKWEGRDKALRTSRKLLVAVHIAVQIKKEINLKVNRFFGHTYCSIFDLNSNLYSKQHYTTVYSVVGLSRV